jgi:hypothetical protein
MNVLLVSGRASPSHCSSSWSDVSKRMFTTSAPACSSILCIYLAILRIQHGATVQILANLGYVQWRSRNRWTSCDGGRRTGNIPP